MSKSEVKEQARCWMGHHTDAAENAASLFTVLLNHGPSRTAESTALLTQNVLWAASARELGGITGLQIHVLV